MNKILIISHIADIDGLGSVVLGKTIYPDVDYELVEFSELDGVISSLIKTGKYREYETIYITDVSIREDTIEKINSNPELQSKIKHFDHHASEVKNNVYPFVNVVLEQNGKETCGTSLFYNHLCTTHNDPVLEYDTTKEFVEAVRARDNWLKNNESYPLGCDLTELQLLNGNDGYIDNTTNRLLNNSSVVTPQEKTIIERRKKNILDYIEECDKRLIFMELDGRNIGVSFSEQFRSEVGNALSQKYVDQIDYVLIVNLMRGQYSFRTVKDDVNVSQIAASLDPNGGGHPKASGAQINANNYYIITRALEEKFKNSKLVKEIK